MHILFIKKFLNWHQNSFGKSEITKQHELNDLIKEAENIWNDHMREVEKEKKIHNNNKKYLKRLESEVSGYMFKEIVKRVKKKTRKKISRYL